MNTQEPWINTGRVDPDGYIWTIDKRGYAVPLFIGNQSSVVERIKALEAALAPFVAVRDQFPESAKIISKNLDGFTPIKVTVTKDQFLAAVHALRIQSAAA